MNGTTYQFPEFLSDESQYRAAEEVWRKLAEQVVQRVAKGELWETPWLNTEFADGSPCMDGNPIFSAVCRERRLALRVIQLEPMGNQGELNYWIDRFAKGEPDEVKELVISCVLTREAHFACMEIVAQWVANETIRRSRENEYSRVLRPAKTSSSREFVTV